MAKAKKKKAASRKKKRKKAAARGWFVYMLECAGQRIYTGITPDVNTRYALHCNGKGAAFTRANPPLRILAAFACASHSEAAKAEARLKKLKRPQKLLWAADKSWPQEPAIVAART